jgi:hypothetical protein
MDELLRRKLQMLGESKILPEDYEHVVKLHGIPLFVEPAPLSTYKGKLKINPHVSRFYYTDNRIVDIFHIKPVYYENQLGAWRPMQEVATKLGNRHFELKEDWDRNMNLDYLAWLLKRSELINGVVAIPSPSSFRTPTISLTLLNKPGYATIHLATLTVYPDPDPETATVDGHCERQATESWATVRAASAATSVDSGTSGSGASLIFGQVFIVDSNNRRIVRGFTLFDTSALGDTDTINSGTLSLYRESVSGTDTCEIIATTPASNTNLVLEDYDQIGSTTFGTFSSPPSGQYTNVSLNASGIAAISKTGVTKLGGRQTWDYTNTAQAPSSEGRFTPYSADDTNGSRDPKLVVDYTPSTSIKTAMDLVYASIKTVDGLAIASTKTINGLA